MVFIGHLSVNNFGNWNPLRFVEESNKKTFKLTMNRSQRVMIFSLAMIVCLAVSSVTSDEVDDAKAAALLAEMLYPEYANNPEFQAVQKRSPSSSESNEKRHAKQVEQKRGPSCTGIPGLDIFGCGEAEFAPVMKRESESNEKRHAKQVEQKRAPSCTGIPGLDIFGCGEAQMAPLMKRDCNSGIPANDLRCKLQAWKRGGGTGMTGLGLLERARTGRRWN